MDRILRELLTVPALTLVLAFATADEQRVVATAKPTSLADATPLRTRAAGYANSPVRFEPNVGQAASQIDYLARGACYDVAITERGAILSLHPEASPQISAPPAARVRAHAAGGPSTLVRLSLVNTETKRRPRAERPQNSVSNYFVGNDPSKWHRNVANYAAVRYEQSYPGVDWVIYGNSRDLEYDFVVAPHANPKAIRLRIDGADGLAVDHNGDLLVHAGKQTLRQLKPVIYQTAVDGKRVDIQGHYVIERGLVSIAVGDYDHDRQLTIDPVLVYSTYLGGTQSDSASAIAVDGSGNVYVTGLTSSTDFPVSSAPFQAAPAGNGNAFVSKFSGNGSQLVYSTYIGGSDSSAATSIAIDNDGEVTIAGYTYSTDFPTLNPIQGSILGYEDAFITKINSAGNGLVYSTYLGGSDCVIKDVGPESGCGATEANTIALDGGGNAYVAGFTTSYEFPTANPFQGANKSGFTGFVSELNATGTALVYSTYLGGSSVDYVNAIAVDGSGNAYVAGRAASTDFPTAGPLQGSLQGEVSAFVTKLNPGGSALVYSTYLGGSDSASIAGSTGAGAGVTEANAITVDSAGNAYITGSTSASNFPTVNPYQAANHALDGETSSGDFVSASNAFVSKLNPSGDTLIYSTYLGGSSGSDVANAIALDPAGSAVVVGSTYSTDFPTVKPVQAMNVGSLHNTGNAFVSQLTPDGSGLEFSTYLGGSGSAAVPCVTPLPGPVPSLDCYEGGDSASAVAVDPSYDFYIAGTTGSPDFPTANPFQGANRSYAKNGTNAFVAKLGMTPLMSIANSQQSAGGGGGSGGGGGVLDWGVAGVLGLALACRRRSRL